jgi:phosphoadenosine phosphosulfate reductase
MDDQEFTELYGEKPYEKDPSVCCSINKVQPLQVALERMTDYKCWLVGLRRDQSKRRQQLRIVEEDGGIVKVHPLANWTRDTIDYYIEVNNVPRNPLFDNGFLSIGCAPEVCTRPPSGNKPGQNERTQRWAGKLKDECGIHTFLESKEKSPEGKSAKI